MLVNGTWTLDDAEVEFIGGNVSCTNTSFATECFDLLACDLDFSQCNLQALSLQLVGATGSNITTLSVGEPSFFSLDTVVMGDSSFPTMSVPFPWKLSEFRVYAASTFIDGDAVQIRSLLSPLNLQAVGTFNNLLLSSSGNLLASSGGMVDIVTTTGYRLLNSGSGTVELSSAFGPVIRTGLNVTDMTDYYELLTSGATPWFKTNPLSSFGFTTNPPILTNLRLSLEVFQDVILQDTVRLVSLHADGYLPMGPFLRVGGGRIKSADAGTLRLQEDTATESLDFRGKISNGDTTGGNQPVWFNDAEGIINEGPLDQQGVISSSTGNVLITDDVDITGTVTITGSLVVAGTGSIQSVSYTDGTLTIMGGDITNLGQINGGGAACDCGPSDMRLKNITGKLKEEEAVERIKRVELFDFNWLPEYNMTSAPQRGVMAQKIEADYPNAIKQVKRKVGNQTFDDLLLVDKTEFIPDLLATQQYLLKQVAELKAQVEELSKRLQK